MKMRSSICSALGSQMWNWTPTSLHLCQYFRQSAQGISHIIHLGFWLGASRALTNSMIRRKPIAAIRRRLIAADRRYARIGAGSAVTSSRRPLGRGAHTALQLVCDALGEEF